MSNVHTVSSTTTGRDLIRSSQIESTSDGGSVDSVIAWMDELKAGTECHVERVPLRKLKRWYFDEGLNLRHETGGFFSIEGIQVRTNRGSISEWCQPVINQPEIGFLGFVCQKIGGVLHFLVQAKIEPGNINVVQLSPTLQATRSNYTQIHQGRKPLFLDHFLNHRAHKVIVDQLQSEQGARFLKKRNRNVVLELDTEVRLDTPLNYRWMTLGALKKLLRYDNVVNMDSRTVLASLALASHHASSESLAHAYGTDTVRNDLLASLASDVDTVNSMDTIVSWFTNLKMHTDLFVERVPLRRCEGWSVEEYSICNPDRKYFEVVGAAIHIVNREVTDWSQPLVRHYESGIVGLIIKKINGIYHLLIQAKMEPGNFDILEMAPTVQCITGSYLRPEYTVPYLDYIVGAKRAPLYDSLLSEEGGRFYQEQNRYVVVELDERDEIQSDERYIWMTLYQAKEFMKFNNYLNVELRSIIASISPV